VPSLRRLVIAYVQLQRPLDAVRILERIAAREPNNTADLLELARLAEERNVPCNAVDDPAHCRFSFGSVVSRDDLTVAISTNGAAPALAVRLRQRLERELGEEYGQFLAMLGELRPEITRSLPDFERRKALWYRMIDSEALDALRQGRPQEAHQLLRRLLEEAKQEAAPDRVKDRAGT